MAKKYIVDLNNVAQLYSLRNWIEYGFKQVKNELGWADFRLTDYESIERWWEIIFGAYLLVSIQATYFQLHTQTQSTSSSELPSSIDFNSSQYSQHPNWESGTTGQSALNNLRLLIQPYIFYCLIQPWLTVFNIPGMKRCFLKLIDFMNDFRASPVSFSVSLLLVESLVNFSLPKVTKAVDGRCIHDGWKKRNEKYQKSLYSHCVLTVKTVPSMVQLCPYKSGRCINAG